MKNTKNETLQKIKDMKKKMIIGPEVTSEIMAKAAYYDEKLTVSGNVVTRITYVFDKHGNLLFKVIESFIVKDASIVAPITSIPVTILAPVVIIVPTVAKS